MEEGDNTSPLTPFLYSDYIYKMLNNALDYGLKESEFWEMTIAELDRYIDSRKRVLRIEEKERATHNYLHALLVGKAVARCFDDKSSFPEIHEVYPSVFVETQANKDEIQERKDELSALRFKQFAESFNQTFIEEEANPINE